MNFIRASFQSTLTQIFAGILRFKPCGSLILMATLTVPIFSLSCTPQVKQVPTPTPIARWTWIRSFPGMQLNNLAMTWNGSMMLFSVEQSRPAAAKDVIVALDTRIGKALNDWGVPGKVAGLSISGDGSRLLAALSDGTALWYPKWQQIQKPRKLMGYLPGLTPSPTGDLIAARTKSDEQEKIDILFPQGKAGWSYPVAGTATKVLFPFMNKPRQVLILAAGGDATLYDGEQPLWKTDLGGAPLAASSSYIENSMIAAVVLADAAEKIVFLDGAGKIRASAPAPRGITSFSCADVGYVCATLSRTEREQRLTLFSEQGKELWRYTIQQPAQNSSKSVAGGHGDVIIAGFEENGKSYLRAWNAQGTPLWNAHIEGGLLDYAVSWNGKRIAVLTRDSRIVFFDLETPKPSQQESVK